MATDLQIEPMIPLTLRFRAFLFDRQRTTAQLIVSNIGILIALWIAYAIARRARSTS